jgi:pimeloyl-ACP methyl ester carboxylesterase
MPGHLANAATPLVGVPRAPGSPKLAWRDAVLSTSHARIAVRETFGERLPLLLIHGPSLSKAVFNRQLESRLGRQYRMIAIDLPGHGDSSNAFDPARTYSIAGYADLALEVLEKLDIDQAAVLGCSLGGHVAFEMISSFPGIAGVMAVSVPMSEPGVTIRHVDAIAPPPLFPTTVGPLSASDVDGCLAMSIGRHGDAGFAKGVRRTDRRAREMFSPDAVAVALRGQRRTVATSHVPLALVAGADDPLVAAEDMSALHYAKIWDRRANLIPGAGPAPFLDEPEAFNYVLWRFMRGIEKRALASLAEPRVWFGG